MAGEDGSSGPERLSEFDRSVVGEMVEELRAAGASRKQARYGWALGVAGLLLLVGWSRLGGNIPGAGFVSPFVWLGGLLCALGGPMLALTSGAGGRRAAEAAVEAALRRLEDPESDRETGLRASVLLLVHGSVRRGATRMPTFEPDQVRQRIRAMMPLVEEVERVLVEEDRTAPVFSRAPGKGGR